MSHHATSRQTCILKHNSLRVYLLCAFAITCRPPLPLQGFWMDMGQPKDYILATRLYLRHLRANAADKLAPSGNGIVDNVLVVSFPFCAPPRLWEICR